MMSVVVGTNDLKSGGTRYKIEKFVGHEKYDKPEFANDIALIRVDGEIKFNDKVQPIKYSNKFVEADADVDIFGWGKISSSHGPTGPWPKRLQVLRTVVIEDSVCKSLIPKNAANKGHMCTYRLGSKGFCDVSMNRWILLKRTQLKSVFSIPFQFLSKG